jgi:hypothetical protein
MPPLNIASVLSRYFLDLDKTYEVCEQKQEKNLYSYVNKDSLQLLHDNNSPLSREHQEKLAYVLRVLNPNNQLHIGEDHHIQKLTGHYQESKIDLNE